MNRYQSNYDFIKAVNPGFIDALPQEDDNSWLIINDGNGEPVNLKNKKSGDMLFETDAPTYEANLFDVWAKNPNRLVINNYQNVSDFCSDGEVSFKKWTGFDSINDLNLTNIHDLNLDLQPNWAVQRAADYVIQKDINIAPAPLTTQGCALVVMGIGLGNHLPILLDTLNPSALFIVEPDLGLLERSLYNLDYPSLINRFTGPNRALDFVISNSPESAVSQICSLLTSRNLFLIDGLYSIITYQNSFFQLVKQLLHSPTTLNGINYLGYFLDEVHMTMNAYLNYKFIKPKVFNSTRVVSYKDSDAVIVASGPSLADDLEILKEYRNRYTLFSCYSTIGKLFDANITPDYHCDLERHNDHIPLIERGFKERLKEISLCASATCDPRLLQLYGSVYSINRGALTPSVIYTEGNDIIPNEGPDVATFAILCAIFFGYRNIHLFGVDLGTANRSVCRLEGALDIDRRTYNIPVRGNQGKTVFSGQLLLDNKRAIEANIAYYSELFPDLKFINYSNGVLIEGATPKKPEYFRSDLNAERINVPSPYFKSYTDEHVDNSWKIADLRLRCFNFLARLRELAKDPFSLSTLYTISDLCNVGSKDKLDQIPIRFYRGSLFRSWIQLYGIYTRLILPPGREEINDEFISLTRSILLEVIDSFESLTFEMIDFVENLNDLTEFDFSSQLHRDNPNASPTVF